MRTVILLSLSLFIVGCGPLSFAKHKSAGENQYVVSASGNKWDTKETLLKTIHKRAVKVCGSDKYKFLNDTDMTISITESYVGYAVIPVPVHSLSRHVQCK